MEKIKLPDNISLENIHTLESDTAEAISKNNISKADIFAAQEKKHEEESIVEEKKVVLSQYKNILLMFLGIVVLLGVSYGVFVFFTKQSKQIPIPVATNTQTEIISYDFVKEINFLNPSKLTTDAVATSTKGGVTFFKLNTSIKDLLLALSPSLPRDFYRAIQDRGFWGSLDGSNFFILTVDSYERSYAGLLAWEPLLKNDLFPIFGISSSNNLSRFEDRVVANKDTRVALDAEGNTLFVYGFYNPETIIFARNSETFKAVSNRLLLRHL